MSVWILWLAGTMMAPASWAQDEPTSRMIIQQAIDAAGGATWKRPETLRLSGHADFFAHGLQSSRLRLDRYEMARVFPDTSKAAHAANGKVYFNAQYGDSIFFRLAFDGQTSDTHLGPRAKPFAEYFRWSNNFGFGIIRFADRPGFQLDRLADDQVEGYPCYFIRVVDPEQQETVFAIDKASHFIRMVGFSTNVGYHHRIYSDFTRSDGTSFVQPQRVRIYFDGVKCGSRVEGEQEHGSGEPTEDVDEQPPIGAHL